MIVATKHTAPVSGDRPSTATGWHRLQAPRGGAASSSCTRARRRSTSAPGARCWPACRCTGWSSGRARSRSSSPRPSGARFTDVDGNEYVDLCLGDTGAMTGHAPAATAEAVCDQVRKGTTLMLPDRGRDRLRRGVHAAASACRSGSSRSRPPTPTGSRSGSPARPPAGPRSSSTTGATTARSTRPSSRSMRTARPQTRPNNIGPAVPPPQTTRVVEINDLDAPRARARPRRRRLLPVRAGAHQHRHRPARRGLPRRRARALHAEYGTFLVIDETHTHLRRARAATPAHTTSSPTSSPSASRSPAASPPPPTA